MTRATLLIPAHNEAAVIGKTLRSLASGVLRNDFRIVVIANGCSDATAQVARSVLPQALVLETDTLGKCNALNLGFNEADRDKPIVCLDADISVTAETVTALVEAVWTDGAYAACATMHAETTNASLWVRSYYKGWQTNPYFNHGKFGGLFALSPRAAARVFPLPLITADDEFVRRSFKPSEVVHVPDCQFTARAPKTLASLLKVRQRSLRGAREVSELGFSNPEKGSVGIVLRRAASTPSLAFPVFVYAAINAWVRVSMSCSRQTGFHQWERDLTTRVAG